MTANKPGDPLTLNRLYGRSVGKPLRKGQQDLIDRLLPQISVPETGPVTAESLFGFDRPLHFEIGFGGGEHMAQRADMSTMSADLSLKRPVKSDGQAGQGHVTGGKIQEQGYGYGHYT